MVEETTSARNQSRVALTIGVSLASLALLAAMAGCLPVQVLRDLAARVRDPDDLTPERYRRYLQVCWFFAVSLAVCSASCFRFRRQMDEALARLRTECAALRTGARRFVRSLPPVAWFLILTGIGVRAWFLNLPMAYDEAYSFVNYASQPVYLGIADYNANNNHLLNTLLMHGMFRVFGQQDWALRIPVFCFGIALLPIVWGWARDRCSENTANLATALAAISPALVSYSVNARGYLYLTTCAVLLDWALFHIATREENRLGWWCVAWLATVVGAWSMPLMAYPALGLFGWFVWEPVCSRGKRHDAVRRIRGLILFGITAAPAIAALYAPAYVFRGLLFLEQVGFDDPSFGDWLTRLPRVLADSASWWLAMPAVIQFAALAGCLAGLAAIARERRPWVPLLVPFAVAFILMGVQQVSPPPRVLLYLSPWAALFCGRGVAELVVCFSPSRRSVSVLAVASILGGVAYLVGRPYLFDERERTDYASIPAAIERLRDELQADESVGHRLIAPLPCDLPSIYYMDQLGFRIPVNGNPEPEETLWLLARPRETPVETLSTPLVGLGEQAERLGPWERIADFDTLVLYRSTRSATP